MDREEYHANDSPANTVAETPVQKSRKRNRRPETWKRNVAKKARHCPKRFPVMPSCGHGTKGSFQCHQLSMQDVRRIHQKYYANADLESKKNYILQHVAVSSAKRSHLSEGQSIRQYIVWDGKAFLGILNESRDRVQRLCKKKNLQLGVTPPETRGEVHQVEKYELKRTQEKHSASLLKQPVKCEENVGNVPWKHVIENLLVEYEFFRTIFDENFNISFDAPYTDKGSTRMSLESKINDERDNTVKHNLQIELLAHKKRADTFYQKLLEKSGIKFRHITKGKYIYLIPQCEGISTSSQNRNHTYFYVWTKDVYAKGPNQIASSLHHRLNKLNLDEVTTVRLFYDGCGGQNKNQTISGMLSHWMLLEAPKHLKDTVLLFPIVGHSYIPPHRVFGNLERYFRHESIIENPEKYLQVFNKFATVTNFGKDCAVSDWKLYSQEILKPPGKWYFQFQRTKKIVLTMSNSGKSILVHGEPFYNFESCEHKTISKKGKTFRNFQIPDVVRGVRMKDAKINYKWGKNTRISCYTQVFQQQTAANVPATARNDNDYD
ncbi:hypothetical protein PR048_002968 [Dryococelus australis]|uniref:Uncharacterized protein n=1 Tax=Dryococelus australis TaxID=614101 RepID=A0ABQ9ILR7_9NEOP|nr:hypothetical protein PR048_002968 [Dryococelus australis]